jgi:Haem-binding uptake, Tiki superfamily, ChaN
MKQELVILGAFYLCILNVSVSVKAWSPYSNQFHYSKAPLQSVRSEDHVNRRSAFGKMIALTTGIVSCGFVQGASAVLPSKSSDSSTISSSFSITTPLAQKARTFEAYYLTPDESNVRSKLDRIDSQRFLQQMATINNNKGGGGAIWLGEHHNSVADHDFQATFIQEVYRHRQKNLSSGRSSNSGGSHNLMAIGLEQVQQEFQPILDAYIDGTISLDRMRFMVQWDKRWTWSFDNYKSIFETAKSLHIPLLALNVDSEDLSLVEKEGYPGLPKEKLRKYIKDP